MRSADEPTAPVAVITGASSGVGMGTALALADRGARVVLVGRDANALETVAAQIRDADGTAAVAAFDVADPQSSEKIMQLATDAFGGVDIWVANAAVFSLGRFWETPLEHHRRVLEVNALGTVAGAHAALRAFVAQGRGTLVIVGSLEAEVPIAFHASYAASKAAVVALARGLRAEVRASSVPRAVRVGSVLPWALDTPLWARAANHLGRRPRMTAMETPDRVVRAVVAACWRPPRARPVGVKARAAELSHRVLPAFTERAAAWLSAREHERAGAASPTDGALFAPQVPAQPRVHGSTRARMRREDRESSLGERPDEGDGS